MLVTLCLQPCERKSLRACAKVPSDASNGLVRPLPGDCGQKGFDDGRKEIRWVNRDAPCPSLKAPQYWSENHEQNRGPERRCTALVFPHHCSNNPIGIDGCLATGVLEHFEN